MRFFATLFLFLATCIAHADQLIIEPEMGRTPLLSAIDSAQHSIDLVMYGFTDKTLLDALIQEKLKGRNLRIILEKNPYKAEDENHATITTLKTHQIPWQGEISPYQLIHQKTLILDNKKALVMTFNFTHGTFKNQRNFALVIDDAKKINGIKSIFSADWNHIPYVNSSSDIILSPDNSRMQLQSLISRAHEHIRIYAQNINDYKIVGALAKAAKKGVKVEIITSGKMREKQSHYLTRSGVEIYYHKTLIIHAKVLMIDNDLAVIGSINLTRHSLDENRELAIITHDPMVLKQLTQTFNKDKATDKFSIENPLLDKRNIHRALKHLQKYIHSHWELPHGRSY